MATTPSFADYAAAGGSLEAERFDAALPEALAFVRRLIWQNTITEATREAYWGAVFAAVDTADDPPTLSERVGNTSVTYAGRPTRREVVSAHLAGTGLLYTGL